MGDRLSTMDALLTPTRRHQIAFRARFVRNRRLLCQHGLFLGNLFACYSVRFSFNFFVAASDKGNCHPPRHRSTAVLCD